MIARYNRISLACGVPGLILQVVGQVVSAQGQETIGLGVVLFGTVLLILGLGYYAVAKGRSPAWALLGFLSIIGLIVLASLQDLEPEEVPDTIALPAPRTSFMGGFMAILSVVCCWAIFFSIIFGIVGMLMNRRVGGWSWYLSIVGTVLSTIMTAIAVTAIVLESSGKRRVSNEPVPIARLWIPEHRPIS